MKGNLGMILALVTLAAVIGFFVGRRSGGDPALAGGDGGGSARGGAPHASKSGRGGGGGDGRVGSVAGGRRPGSSPEAAIRGVVRELELSPMINMDFDSLLDAYQAIRNMSPEEVRAALAELDAMEVNQQTKMMVQMMLISRWSKEDGQGAVEFAMEQDQPMLKMMGVMSGMMAWAREDPETAYAWYEEHRNDMQGGMMGRGQLDGLFFASLAQRDMDGAFDRLGKLNKGSRRQALHAMAGQLAMDPIERDEFLGKLDGLEDQSERDEVIQQMVSGWAWQDPQGAVKFIEDQEYDADLKKSLMDSVAGSWSLTDPEAALTWRVESTDGEERSEAIADGFGSWVMRDQEGAEAWLARQPDDLRSDALYQKASQTLMWGEDFEKAASYAEQIEDEGAKTSQMGDVFDRWTNEDPEKAQEWFDGLDEATRSAIESPPMPDEIHSEDGAMPWNRPIPGEGDVIFEDPAEGE